MKNEFENEFQELRTAYCDDFTHSNPVIRGEAFFFYRSSVHQCILRVYPDDRLQEKILGN